MDQGSAGAVEGAQDGTAEPKKVESDKLGMFYRVWHTVAALFLFLEYLQVYRPVFRTKNYAGHVVSSCALAHALE